jgi:hypothetical protein
MRVFLFRARQTYFLIAARALIAASGYRKRTTDANHEPGQREKIRFYAALTRACTQRCPHSI